MKQYKVLMTEPAADDLQSIARYIADELLEPAIAKKLVGKIKEAVMSLAKLPTRHALVADERIAAQGIRKLIVENDRRGDVSPVRAILAPILVRLILSMTRHLPQPLEKLYWKQ